MRYKFRIWHAVIAGVNLISIAGALVLTGVGSSMAGAQRYNGGAERWDGSGGCTQISCFLSGDSGFTSDMVGGVRAALLGELKNISVLPEEGKTLVPDAYSAPVGTSTVRSDGPGRSEADITAVGGDFFLFRSFTLLSGAFFTEKDIMQDGAVIDRDLAWRLYGSENVAGMNLYIDGVQFYIAGVIDAPSTKPEKKCAGDTPKAYISYEGASGLSMSSSAMSGEPGAGSTGFSKVTVYECISPSPVENYAYNAVNKYFEGSYKGMYTAVDNTVRFEPGRLAKAFRKRWKYSVRDDTVVYPWWENASRIVEYRLSALYFLRRLLLIPPVLTLLWLLFLLWRFVSRRKGRVLSWAVDSVYRIRYNMIMKKQKKDNIDKDKE